MACHNPTSQESKEKMGKHRYPSSAPSHINLMGWDFPFLFCEENFNFLFLVETFQEAYDK